MTAVVVTLVLLLVAVGLVAVTALIVVMVTVIYRRWRKQHAYQYADAIRGAKDQETSRLGSTICYERMTADMDHTHIHHQPRPLHTPHTTSDNGDHMSLQDCPIYQSVEDTPTSSSGEDDHISMQDCPLYQATEEEATSGDYSYI